tara:strand:- start:472 stop:810 length:339 start_codon:yes stop_codon:yes gene_type:complete
MVKIKLLKVLPSKKSGKKYDAYFLLDNEKEKVVSFGASDYRDYILINDKNSKWYLPKILDRNVTKASYRRRHEKDLETKDPTRPGYLSYYILWNKKTLGGSIKHFKNKFKLN